MAAEDNAPAPGHLRRRSTSSHEHDDDDYAPIGHQAEEHSAHMVDSSRTQADAHGASRASGTDTVAHHPRESLQEQGAGRSVRFSQDDVQRNMPPQRSVSDVGSHAARGGAGTTSSQSVPAPAPVKINTEEARRAGATNTRSPPTSPLSPGGRTRGYSLRRALFQRNISHDGQQDEAAIELEPTASSSSGTSSASPPTRPSTGDSKKSGDANITISPVNSTFDDAQKRERKGGLLGLPNYEQWLGRKKGNKYARYLKPKLEVLRKKILRIQEIPPSKDGRHVPLDASRTTRLIDERTNKEYTTNWIRSTRYSAWDFVPRQLFAQFRKLANFYFLGVSILQMIPGLSTTGTYTTIVPLMFFVALSIAKEGYDDLRRHRLDKIENNRDATVLRAREKSVTTAEVSEEERWTTIKWDQLRVGDIVKLKRDDPVPADLVLLHSSGENNVAYVETMALDGETNLKTKQTPATIAPACTTELDVMSCHATFVAEDPNVDLYKFEGRVSHQGTTSPLTNNEILYRNSVLRNTPSIIGMVIYSGEECKIRMNANKNPRIKAPRLQTVVNKIVILMVCFVVALSLFNSIAYEVWRRDTEQNSFYLLDARVPFHEVFISFIIMFNTLIPLSLYVSMEIIKVIQLLLMNWDVDMYDPLSDTPFKAQTSTINEELGQVSYVFSDKTGTLTDNVMKFRKVSVGGAAFLHDFDLGGEEEKTLLKHKKRNKDKGKEKRKRKSFALGSENRASAVETGLGVQHDADPVPGQEDEEEPQWQSTARPAVHRRELKTKDMITYIQRRPHTAFARKAKIFLLSIALCHTCLPEVQADGTTDFQAASPDELALVRAAQELGFLIVDRNLGTITLRYQAGTDSNDVVEETYEILDVIEFSSKRKRMSVIVRFPSRKTCVITKGADSVIMQRMKLSSFASKKAAEIEDRVNKRRSLEASMAMARKSSVQIEQRRSSVAARPSLSRRSTGGGRVGSAREGVDLWLRERENDVQVSRFSGAEDALYTPRPSTTLNRQSMAISEARSSLQWDEEEDLVDEAMVNDEAAVVERCLQHINDFATEGLRTLLYGYRFISDDEYNGWKKIYLDASTSLSDRERKIEQAGEQIELDLDLAGATAIEDKLQQGVPEAIDKLRRASIKMWMLTGDKRETAINIGHSCRLIKDYSILTILDQELGEVDMAIGAAIVKLDTGTVAHSVVVVDGQTLSMIEGAEALEKLFFDLAIRTDSVICCRASPSQKAKLVKGIRNRVNHSITLAIGDGANDIAMIQTAHVGIGITGKEGLQAARTSDYAVAQFRFLTKLLLVHGRWNYTRTCKYIVGTFWKEMLFYLTAALYQRWNGYTGTSLYESWSLSMFNTLFTSLPVICMGSFEKDLQASTLLAVPELYTKGQRDGGFNFTIFFGWMFMASCEAMIVYFVMFALYGMAVILEDESLFPMGTLTFSACVILISLKMQLIEMHNKSVLAFGSIFISVGGWFLWNVLLAASYDPKTEIYRVRDSFFTTFGPSGLWWFTLILIVLSAVVFEYGISSLRAAWFTTDADEFQALEQDLEVRKRFEEASAAELQGGWEQRGKKKKTSEEVLREEEEVGKQQAEQEQREEEVREILRSRPDELSGGAQTKDGGRKSLQGVMNEVGKTSMDVSEMLSQRFGSVKRK